MAGDAEDDDWEVPMVAPRHQVLLVDSRPGGQAALLPSDDASEPWPRAGLKFLVQVLQEPSEPARCAAILDRFDVGAVPRLLHLALREPGAAAREALQVLRGFAGEVPEIAAELLRSQAHVLQHLRGRGGGGACSREQRAAAEAAADLIEACRRSLEAVGEDASAPWLSASPLEDQHWLAYGCRHYVLRFAAACPEVPLGSLPPPAAARLAAFGRAGEEGVADAVGYQVVTRRVTTGGRLWHAGCAGLLLAREVLAELAPRLRGRHVLDLGCGLGFAGLAAAVGAGAAGCVLADVEPTVVEAARTNARLAGGEVAARARAERVDARDLAAVRALALEAEVSVVLASDLIYGPLSPAELAEAAAAALPRGGLACLLLPARYRTGMDCTSMAEALAAAGLVVTAGRRVDHGQAHFHFTACEDDQEYVLYEATMPDPASATAASA